LAKDRTSEAQERAERSFKKKEIQRGEGAKAYAEYQAQYKVTEMKTARLKEARLAKEAAERAAAVAAPPPAGKKPKAK
jgi:hypothetical protein